MKLLKNVMRNKEDVFLGRNFISIITSLVLCSVVQAQEILVQKRAVYSEVGVYGMVKNDNFLGTLIASGNEIVNSFNFRESTKYLSLIYKHFSSSDEEKPVAETTARMALEKVIETIDPRATYAAFDFQYPESEKKPTDEKLCNKNEDGSFKLNQDVVTNYKKILDQVFPINRGNHLRFLFFKDGEIRVWEFYMSSSLDEIVKIEESTLTEKFSTKE